MSWPMPALVGGSFHVLAVVDRRSNPSDLPSRCVYKLTSFWAKAAVMCVASGQVEKHVVD